MTLTLDFQGQILKKSYLRNGMADWHGIKRMWIDRMLDPCCDSLMSTSPMTFTLDFQGQILKKSYLRNGMADWHGRKWMWIDRVLHPLCVFQHSPHPWAMTLTLDFLGQILKNSYLRNGMADWHGRKGIWVDRMLDPCWAFNVLLFHDLDLGFSRSNFEKVVSQDWDGRLTWNEREVSW